MKFPVLRRVRKTPALLARPYLLLLAAVFYSAIGLQCLHAEDVASLFTKAQELMRRQEFSAAIPLLDKCVAAKPDSSKFHQWLGRAIGLQAAQDGIMSSAMKVGRVKAELKAVELDSSNLEARHDLALFYKSLPGMLGGSNAKAAEQVSIIRQSDPALAAQIEGDFLANDKKYDAALAAYSQSSRLNGSRPLTHVRIALIYQQNKDWQRAFDSLDRALAIDSNYPAALYQVGRTAALGGEQLDRGEKCLRTYIGMPLREDLENPPRGGGALPPR